MLAQISTVKSRLQILDTDTTYDALLTSAIEAISARFDKETNRILARTENATDEFDAADTELVVSCYPIETVTKFETKTTESEGWIEQPTPDYLIRRACVISLTSSFSLQPSAFSLCRVTYTGGYVLPGTTPAPGQTPLPSDVEHAAVEQIAFWFTNREKQGIKTNWPKDSVYQQFATQDLLESVASVLEKHRRWTL
jgi:hypothetical protein